jgi:hypothetical protein
MAGAKSRLGAKEFFFTTVMAEKHKKSPENVHWRASFSAGFAGCYFCTKVGREEVTGDEEDLFHDSDGRKTQKESRKRALESRLQCRLRRVLVLRDDTAQRGCLGAKIFFGTEMAEKHEKNPENVHWRASFSAGFAGCYFCVMIRHKEIAWVRRRSFSGQ